MADVGGVARKSQVGGRGVEIMPSALCESRMLPY
jgi:hypothetical protein